MHVRHALDRQDGQQLRVSVSAAAVFGRAGASTADQLRSAAAGGHRIDMDVMSPAVIKVVLVAELLGCFGGLADGEGFLVAEEAIVHLFNIAVEHIDDVEQMQVIALPSHGDLNQVMQLAQRQRSRNDQASPDWWVHVAQGDRQLHGLLPTRALRFLRDACLGGARATKQRRSGQPARLRTRRWLRFVPSATSTEQCQPIEQRPGVARGREGRRRAQWLSRYAIGTADDRHALREQLFV